MLKQILIVLFILSIQQIFAQTQPVLNIGERTLTFTDKSRNRPIVTEIWYPTEDSLKPKDKVFSPFTRKHTVQNGRLPSRKLPLILLSHGTGGGRLTIEWLAQSLVQSGFIVAAVDHWGNTYEHKLPLEFVKTWERPLDISFALTALLGEKELSRVIDQQRVGAAGFSFGGYTVLALAGAVVNNEALSNYLKTTGKKELEVPEFPGLSHYLDDSSLIAGSKVIPTLKDNRIRAFFAISPALGAGFIDKRQVQEINRPVYIIGSQSDSITPVQTNALHFHKLISGSDYYEFKGKTGHYVMLNEANEGLKMSAPLIFSDDPSVSRQQVHVEVSRLANEFFKRHLK
ncbi:dienelactone hydrolase [Rhodocytophaga rosea]|uniref:Dienelactone hydrolase n=1 Tax=Rhodocytophaga rosea TaxID=2704465 RepID=A0A6C0GP71_9BACT|nr:dienelactone hydrolase [Rhodocytophaga rosea]QHT69654.1 dienelactone hydrolase [Rhodocytophaga rosea]